VTSVSVLMATYNGARYINEQLNSLAAQTHRPSELIITDDGSTDETLKVVNEFVKAAPFPVLVHGNQTQMGYAANFLHATTYCKSDLIAFCDQDDIWEQRKLETCVPYFDNPDVLLVYHNAITIAADGRRIGSLNDFVLPRVINPPMSIGPWPFVKGFTQVFRRSLPLLPDLWETSRDCRRSGERMAHDQWFFFLSSVLGSIAYLKEPLVYYRQHSSNTVGLVTRERLPGSVRRFFSNYVNTYAHLELCAHECANILDKAKEGWPDCWNNRASVAASKYRRLTHLYAYRRSLYSSSEFTQRLQAFNNILSSGGYKRHDSYNFGPTSFVKDAILGIPVGNLLNEL
jgi:glycosyltransferase involved in cell wall biosynthesis